jgi:hypothetical protein
MAHVAVTALILHGLSTYFSYFVVSWPLVANPWALYDMFSLLPILVLIPASFVCLVAATVAGRKRAKPLLMVSRIATIVFIATFVANYTTANRLGIRWSESALRHSVEHRTDLAKVQAWAVETLNKHKDELDKSGSDELQVKSTEMPDYVRRITYFNWGAQLSGQEAKDRHVTIVIRGGHFSECGLLVGAPTFTTKESLFVYKWRPGVYAFFGPPRASHSDGITQSRP